MNEYELTKAKYISSVNNHMIKIINKNINNDFLKENILYSVISKGKRLRPILFLASNELFDKYSNSLTIASAIEFIHTYSLIHDDLPCMDDDDFRRGKLTHHKVYGEGMAVLTGDALLNLSFETCLSIFDTKNYEKFISAIKYIYSNIGVNGMILGQIMDIKNSDSMIMDNVNNIYYLKTAKLIQASLVSGAILGNATSIEIDQIEKLGKYLGISFQLKDDIEDFNNSSAELNILNQNNLEFVTNELNNYKKLCHECIKNISKKEYTFLDYYIDFLLGNK